MGKRTKLITKTAFGAAMSPSGRYATFGQGGQIYALDPEKPRRLVLRGGAVIEPSPADEDARAIHEFNRRAAAHPRLDAIILPNRGGRDGVLIAAVRAGAS